MSVKELAEKAELKAIGEELVEKAELISVLRGYKKRRTRRKEGTVDFTVSHSASNEKILIRVITDAKSQSGHVDVDTVKEMSELLKKRKYDKGILIGKRFTNAAQSAMEREQIEAVSEVFTPRFTLERLYLAVNSCIETLCKAKCGHVPEKESDCEGFVDGHYCCDVRLRSDNASFHLEHGWIGFLEKDLAKLLAIEKALNKVFVFENE